MRTVEFRGYEINVPAGWPVYRLDLHPDQCVRYDIHAVYLGTPGGDQNCPPGLAGRTETVSIGASAGEAPPDALGQRAVARGAKAQANASDGTASAAGAGRQAGPGVMFQEASLQEVGIAMPASAPSVIATYGSDPGLVEQVLASVRRVIPQSALQLTPRGAKGRHGARRRHAAKPVASRLKPAGAVPTADADDPLVPGDAGQGDMPSGTSDGWPAGLSTGLSATPPNSPPTGPANGPPNSPPTGPPTGPPAALPTAPPTPVMPTPPVATVSKGPQAGFDTCTAPPLKTMQAWRAKFSATAIYIGGEEMACDYGNLSASWVHATEAMGWSLMPTFVGPQAPCNSFSGKVDVKHAAAQGRQNAQAAVQDAQMLGLGRGAPIYYDMESYNHKKARCVTAVLTFLDAWTRELNAEGYVSGVYSSADAAVFDLARTASVSGHQLAEPQAIWFALWDHASDLDASPDLPLSMWPALHRSKQYAGGHWVKVGKIGMDVDSDLVNSAAVR